MGQHEATVVVRTSSGAVRGRLDDGLAHFQGVPFAASPFGANRFLAPQPVEAWDGTRDALAPGSGVPQPVDAADPFGFLYNPATQGEDCLNLAIWSPDVATAGLPVMVWIHGGGYAFGAGSARAHDGSTFARDGIVHVSINYRLNVDGFTYLGEGTDNLGLRDQVVALEWVRDNIAAFGGDPGNVTIFGQSGGGVSVMNLLAMPSARGLFVRAIAQSGSPYAAVAVDDALEVTAGIAARYGLDATPGAFATVPVDQTIQQVNETVMDWLDVAKWGSRTFMISPFRAVHGTESLPEPLLEAGRSSSVPLLTGLARNETVGFLQLLGLTEWAAVEPVLQVLGVDDDIRETYRSSRGLDGALEVADAAWTDWAFRIPTYDLVDARIAAPTHVYEFRFESPMFPPKLGAVHALENPFVFDLLEPTLAHGDIGAQLLGEHPPAELATRMHRAWIDYATTGEPGWPSYDAERRATMLFDRESELVDDAAGPERLAWAGKR